MADNSVIEVSPSPVAVREFIFDVARESFVITNPEDGSEIIVPRLKKLFEAVRGHPSKEYFAVLSDGAKIAAHLDRMYDNSHYGSRTLTISHREQGWLIYGHKGSGGHIMADEDESVKGEKILHLIDPETYFFQLMNFRQQTQFAFNAVILDHRGLKRKHSIEKDRVEGKPLQGFRLGYSFVPAAQLPMIEQKFLEDFDAKIERSSDVAARRIFDKCFTIFSRKPSVDGWMQILQGDPRKSEALFTIERYFGRLHTDGKGYTSCGLEEGWMYETPDQTYDFFARDPHEEPVLKQDHIAIYKTLGGLIIEDSRKQEIYYLMGEARTYIRTTQDFLTSPFDPFHLEVSDWGTEREYGIGRTADGADGPVRGSKIFKTIFDSLHEETVQRSLLQKALAGNMPVSGEFYTRREAGYDIERLADISDLNVITPVGP